jgi:hypothetical protein
VIDETLVEEAGGFIGFRLMLDGREEQRVERGMLLLDDAGDFAVAPDVPAAFEPGNERERDDTEHGPAIQALRDGVTIQRGQQEGSAHKDAEREDHREMAEESRATQASRTSAMRASRMVRAIMVEDSMFNWQAQW